MTTPIEQRPDLVCRIVSTLEAVEPGMKPTAAMSLAFALSGIDMDRFFEVWQKRRFDFPDHLSPLEARIIGKLLDLVMADPEIEVAVDWNYLGVVDDDPEEGVPWTRDRSKIEAETSATEITFYRFRQKGTNERRGWVMLVHGNGEDVVTDYGVNEWLEPHMQKINHLVDQIQMGSLGE